MKYASSSLSALNKIAIFEKGAEPGGYLNEVPIRIAVS
jgi:hypothetical protein